MGRHKDSLAAAARQTTWVRPASCRSPKKYLLLPASALLLASIHLFSSWGRPFSTGKELRQGTAGDHGGVSRDTVQMVELGHAALLPAPPSPQHEKASETGVFPFPPKAGGKRPAKLGRTKWNSSGRTPFVDVDPFPWPDRQNFMPNYFLSLRNATRKPASFDENSVLVFMHHNKAAGTTTKKCLSTLANADLGRSEGPVLSSEGRLVVEARFARNRMFRTENVPNTYGGGYALGICDRYRKPCAYFTVMRDPYERTLSSHLYCQRARQDQLCTAQVAKRVTLREWAIHQGSFFFRQLLFQPEFCTDKTRWVRHIDINAVPHEFFRHPDSLYTATCWFREKLIMELTLNQTQHDALLQHCLDNLERWFAVIMLVDHYEESLQMAQEAFKLPFHDLCAGRHDNTGSYNKTVNPFKDSRGVPQQRTNATNPASNTPSVESQLHELRQDPEVQRVLRADDLLYQKGVEIFQKQRAIFNQIESRT